MAAIGVHEAAAAVGVAASVGVGDVAGQDLAEGVAVLGRVEAEVALVTIGRVPMPMLFRVRVRVRG